MRSHLKCRWCAMAYICHEGGFDVTFSPVCLSTSKRCRIKSTGCTLWDKMIGSLWSVTVTKKRLWFQIPVSVSMVDSLCSVCNLLRCKSSCQSWIQQQNYRCQQRNVWYIVILLPQFLIMLGLGLGFLVGSPPPLQPPLQEQIAEELLSLWSWWKCSHSFSALQDHS